MGIKRIIAIASAKGGVGKSTICANLANRFSQEFNVGILDADIYGPNQHIIFKLEDQKPEVKIIGEKKNFLPIISNDIKINGMGFILEPDKAAMWRGPMLSSAIKQLVDLTEWGDLDYLFIDMPPGTGDAYLTVAKDIKPDSVILVTSSSPLSIQDTIKSKILFTHLKIPILGYINNMSYSLCPKCGEKIADYDELNISEKLNLIELGLLPRCNELANNDFIGSSIYFDPIYNELLKLV